jgi:hypothetical protein
MCKSLILLSLLLAFALAVSAQADIIIDANESCRVDGDPARRDENRHDSSKLSMRTSSNGWKSWVKFDLGDLDVGNLETATLTVALNRGKGGNNRFDVSCVNDDFLDNIDWDERSITWNNAPGNNTAVLDLLDPTKTTFLTTVNFTDGVAGDPFTIDVLEVLEADTDGIVQFVFHNSNNLQDLATHDHAEVTWRPFIDATEGTRGKARKPYPAKGATDVSLTPVLSWTPGEFALAINGHTVYFSESFNDVNDGIGGVTQSASSYAPPQRLDFDKTYYWRVDEVSGAPDFTVYQGDVWSFTTEPVAHPIANVTATASSSVAGQGPENTVNGSGLSNDLHSTETEDMWLSDMGGPQPTWIQFEFDKVRMLHEMWVWNSNTDLEIFVGFGFRDVTIEYSVDGIDYTTLGTTHEFAQAPGADDYAHNTTVDLGGLQARYVRLTVNSGWGGFFPQFGLSEVRFFDIPVSASQPSPDSGAADVDVDVTLSWRAGRQAAEHNVYLSTDEQAVIDGTAPVTVVTETSHSPSSLELGSTYYWRVDEVNAAETLTTWQGDIWSFSTQDYLVVDDFESYNEIPSGEPGSKLIYETWADGFAANPATNGSTIGYLTGASMETDTVHGGNQSAPLLYDNSVASLSEVTVDPANLPIGRDWTMSTPEILVLWFYGDPGNAVTEKMYVKLNGNKVDYDGDAADIGRPRWGQWNIDLAAFGVDLNNVTQLGIGLERTGAFGGTGTVFIDDITLYRLAPEPPEEVFFEAEAADTITPPMQVYDDPAASGGQYIAAAPGSASSDAPPAEGVATYSVTVQGGVYKIIGRAFAADGSNDSFWLRILDSTGQIVPTNTVNDASGWARWNGIKGLQDDNVEWHWEDVFSDDDGDRTVHFTMAAGTYTLEIAYRDACKLDAIVITDDVD